MTTQPLSGYSQPSIVPTSLRRPIARRSPASLRVGHTARPETPRDHEKEQLLVRLLPLVKRVAYHIHGRLPAHVELDELLANGVLGLVDAVAKFDSSKRVKLESYARHRIRGAILDGLRSADPASRDLRRKNKKIQKLYRELESKLGRQVSDEEISTALGTSLDEWHRTLNEIQCVRFDFGGRSLSASPTTVQESAEPAHLADDYPNPFDLCYRREQSVILARAITRLRERDRLIITLYYREELSMREIAGRLNLDESRVSQLHSAALVRLKASADALLRPARRQSPFLPALRSQHPPLSNG